MNNQNILNIIIQRDRPRGEYVHGRLSIDGNRICQTLENSLSMTPSGEYEISLIKCKQYSRKMPCLNPQSPCDLCKKSKNSPLGSAACNKQEPSSLNFTLPCYCPQIKPGNGIHNRLDGSILVGKYNCLGSLIHPKDAFDSLYERIRKSVSRGNQVKITIKEG